MVILSLILLKIIMKRIKDENKKIKFIIINCRTNYSSNLDPIFLFIYQLDHSMQQPFQQPATHSLLRESQRRLQSFTRNQPNSSPSNQLSHRPQNTHNSKYHYNYSKSSNLSSHKKGISSSLYESKYMSKQRDSPNVVRNTNSNNFQRQLNPRHSMIVPSTQEKIVVCQSLPKTRPKYSFTFTNLPPNQSLTQPLKNTHPQQSENLQNKPHTPRASLQSNPSSQRSPNIRKDLDMCLYSISDKLKQLQQQQKQTKTIIQSKFQNPSDNSYRPSISQIRKNKKMFLDKSIHRIHPEIVNQYIETVYREYNIPDPLKSGERRSGQVEEREREISQFEVKETTGNSNENRIRYGDEIYKPAMQVRNNELTKSEKDPEKPIATEAQPPKTLPHQLPQKPFRQQYYLHNAKFPSNPNHRKNNLISSNPNQHTKNRKKKFLDLTLSKQKPINPKTFNSPNQQQPHKLSSQKQQSSRSQNSSQSRSRHSSSQKKIMEIKKKISTWNDHEHQYAQRYSYIQSPYEIIRNTRPQPTNNPNSTNAPVNICIRPFQQLMKVTAPTQPNEHYSTKGQNTTQQSQFLESKYVQSYFTQEGEVIEEFRFCVLCELPVLSVNISRHEQKCIGWVDNKGKLINFKDLYALESEDQLKEVIKGKIIQIRKRMTHKIKELKDRQKLDPVHNSKLTSNIIQSVQNLVQTFIMMTDFDQRTPQNSSLFSSGYKKIQQHYKSEYIQLLQEAKKLHWFVKLQENYQRSIEKLNTTNQGISKEKGFTSTKAKHNQSLTFIEEEDSQNNQVISEFGSQREQQ